MLVQFKFKNFGPFKDEVIFDMRAIKAYKEHPYNLITLNEKEALLKVATICAANAGGKSNFVKAYRFFQRIVVDSFTKKGKEKTKSTLSRWYYPFLFDEEYRKACTEFEAVYRDSVNEYRYGFIYDRDSIHYEWLYKRSIETGRQSTIIERSPARIDLGASIKKSCGKYVSDIDKDVLTLSFLSSLKLRTTVFKDTLMCIHDFLAVSLSEEQVISQLLELYFDEDFNEDEKKNLLEFLNAIDVGIKDVSVEKNDDNVLVYTYHRTSENELYKVPFIIESDGTKKAIAVFSLVRVAILYDQGLILDELNNQLHPLLLKYIVDLFYNAEKSRGQLIYTTHDTTLLDKQYMRRDQIWFGEKNDKGEASLYSLAEFKVRKDQSYEKDYLGGVYGGIPILKEFSFEGD